MAFACCHLGRFVECFPYGGDGCLEKVEEVLGQTHIADFWDPITLVIEIEENVGWVYVSVNDVFTVDGVETLSNLFAQKSDLLEWHADPFINVDVELLF